MDGSCVCVCRLSALLNFTLGGGGVPGWGSVRGGKVWKRERFSELREISHQEHPKSKMESPFNSTVVFHCFLLANNFLKLTINKISQNIPQSANIQVTKIICCHPSQVCRLCGQEVMLVTVTRTRLGEESQSPGTTNCPTPLTENGLNISGESTLSRCIWAEHRPYSLDNIWENCTKSACLSKGSSIFCP